jgi:superfamily II DNA helicase RecQ
MVQSIEWKTLLSDPDVKRKIVMVAVDEAHCISE